MSGVCRQLPRVSPVLQGLQEAARLSLQVQEGRQAEVKQVRHGKLLLAG